MFQNIGEILFLLLRTLRLLPRTWHHRKRVADQLFEIGNASLLMACILSLFIGGAIALETGPELKNRGLANAIGGLVGLALCKEMAPVMISFLIAGRIGSAMAAEIGSMRAFQEIDALRTMNIDPVEYLVLPRMVAITIALPMLVIFAILVGWTGGAIASVYNHDIHISFQSYFTNLRKVVEIHHIVGGLIKTVIFAIVIGVISCHQGLTTIGGPRGIGRSVTKAVVNSLVLILILNYLITRILMAFDP